MLRCRRFCIIFERTRIVRWVRFITCIQNVVIRAAAVQFRFDTCFIISIVTRWLLIIGVESIWFGGIGIVLCHRRWIIAILVAVIRKRLHIWLISVEPKAKMRRRRLWVAIIVRIFRGNVTMRNGRIWIMVWRRRRLLIVIGRCWIVVTTVQSINHDKQNKNHSQHKFIFWFHDTKICFLNTERIYSIICLSRVLLNRFFTFSHRR